MAGEPLPRTVDPLRLAAKGALFEGDLPVAGFRRLGGLLADTTGTVHVRLAFGRDADDRPAVRQTITGHLQVVCQRCFEALAVSVDGETELVAVVSDDQARGLPPDREPLVTRGEPVDVATLIEDELLLRLPMAPMHEEPCHRYGSGTD